MDIADFKSMAELGMGIVSLVALVVISFRLLTIIGDVHKEVRSIRLELSRAIGYVQAYLSRHREGEWTERKS